jgi:hypothetical protein
MIGGVSYDKVDQRGLHITEGKTNIQRCLEVDHIVVCAGQMPLRDLEAPLTKVIILYMSNIYAFVIDWLRSLPYRGCR